MSVSPKVNLIVWFEFEPAYYDVAVQHANNHTTSFLSYKCIGLVSFRLLGFMAHKPL